MTTVVDRPPIHVACVRVEVHLPGCRSLKAKRSIIKRIVERTRSRFNVSIAEVGHNDLHQRATLGITVVGNAADFVNSVADKVRSTIRQSGVGHIIDSELEILSF